jgi:hypothetical protein
MNADVAGIIRAQRVLSRVNTELGRRAERPIEEDFIFAEQFGKHPGKPVVREIEGVPVVTRMLHRRGLRQRDIEGADLLYEVEGRKYALVQYKSPTDGRIHRDRDQLDRLIDSCPNRCPPYQAGLWPTCGSWFAVESDEGSWYGPACQALSVFDDALSRPPEQFGSGVPKDVFQQLFARCWIGARISLSEFAYLTWEALVSDRVLVSVLQRGSFGAW